MISTTHATKILFEDDSDKRADLIKKLSEEDAKYLLSLAIRYMRGEVE